MISTTKILFLLLPFGVVLLIATVYHSSNSSGYADNIETNVLEPQVIRHRRTIQPMFMRYCKFNQYYDQEEGRCMGVPGGGKVLHVENSRSCGINILKPHCKSSLYYHICKRDKSILAQCASGQIFDNRLQRCVFYDSSKLIPNVILPDVYMYYDHVRMPSCTRAGRFPVPGHCFMFYTCDTNGHRLFQSVFRCPQNTGYQVDRGVCNVLSDCVNNNSVDTTVCVPDAPDENVKSPSLDEEENVTETPEILEENKASADDPIAEKEESVNSMTYDDIVTTTLASIIGLPENNYNDNDDDAMDVSSNSAKSGKKDLISDAIDEKITHSQASNSAETVQNEENGSLLGLRITSPTTEFDDTPHSIMSSMTSIKPEYRANANVDSKTTNTAPFSSSSYILSKLGEETQDVTTEQYKNIEDSAVPLSNFNTEAIDSYPSSMISNAPEIPPISDVPFEINEKMQDATIENNKDNEDSVVTSSNFNTDSIDPYPIPTISNVSESSPIGDMSSKINDEMQDAITEQYKNNEDGIVTPSDFNTDSVDTYSARTISDVPESSPISDPSSKINDEMQDAITQQNKNDEDIVVTQPNFNADSINPDQTPTLSSVPEFSPISDVSSKINDEMQDAIIQQNKNNEDSVVTQPNFNADSIDLNSTSTMINIPESSPMDVSPNIDEKIQDEATTEYRNNEDTASNFNTDSVDLNSTPTMTNVPESSSIDVSPNIDEKMQDAAIEEYRNNEDAASNFNADSVHPTESNISEPTLINDTSLNPSISYTDW